MSEKFFGNKEIDGKTRRENISGKMKDIIRDYNKERNFTKEQEKREKIESFDNELRSKGLKPLDYELFFVLKGMNLPVGGTKFFDTEDKAIENFVKDNFENKV